MSLPDNEQRPWRTIAKELVVETEAKRIVELSDELDAACAAQWIKPENGGCAASSKTIAVMS